MLETSTSGRASTRKWLEQILSLGGATILEEGRLLACVHHRNVVSIYGADCFDDRVGLWMELINGETLPQAMERGRAFSPADAVRIGIELASAIGAVHDAGDPSRHQTAQRIRVDVQLVQVPGETSLWSDRFDRELTDISAIKDDISRAIANRLRLHYRGRLES